MISEGYVRAGAKVYISSRDAAACEEACKQLNELGPGSAAAIPADFYKEEDCRTMAEELGRREKGMFCIMPRLGAWVDS
jgi:NAD(P)-dependent dehydrogenase (short-subunit alcohol dehydrogenase family)